MVGKIGRILVAIVLILGLSSCTVVTMGPAVVQKAIALQLDQTQQELSQELRLNSQESTTKVQRVQIKKQKPLQIEGLQAYQVAGTYDYTIKLPGREITQRQNPFEVYLQRQKEGKTWRLARLIPDQDGTPQWVTWLLQ